MSLKKCSRQAETWTSVSPCLEAWGADVLAATDIWEAESYLDGNLVVFDCDEARYRDGRA